MPFPDPPVPSTFDVGDINAGHAHFDTTGVTFYSTDGVTPLFHFAFATGQLTFSSQGAGQRIAMLANLLEFFSGLAGEDPGTILGTLIPGVVGQNTGAMDIVPPRDVNTRRRPRLRLASGDGVNANNAVAYLTSDTGVQDVIPFLCGWVQDGSGRRHILNANTAESANQRLSDFGEPNPNVGTPSAGKISCAHQVGVLPVYAGAISRGNGTQYYFTWDRASSDLNTLVFNVRDSTGATPANGTTIPLAYHAIG